jgi:hypothetical protein
MCNVPYEILFYFDRMDNILDHVYIIYFYFGMQPFFFNWWKFVKIQKFKNDFGGFQLLEARERKEE